MRRAAACSQTNSNSVVYVHTKRLRRCHPCSCHHTRRRRCPCLLHCSHTSLQASPWAREEPASSQRCATAMGQGDGKEGGRKQPPALAAALSGALSGAAISACVQPLDVLRTRMQADAALGTSKGVLQTLQVLLSEGGVRGMWRGTGPTVVRLSVGAGINFVALEKLKHHLLTALPHASGQLGFLQAAAVGGLARALSAAVMSPVTLVKTRMEYGGPKHVAYRNTAHALATIAAQEGPAGLFRGLWPTVLTNAPFSALYYMMYTQLRGVLAGVGRERPGSGGGDCGSLHPTLVNFLSGVCAATAATLLTQPSDVVRTRIQLGLPGTAGGGNALATLGAVARGGPGALLAGAAPRVLKRTLQTALVWTLYEELLPRLSGLYSLAMAQQDAAREEAEAAGHAAASGGKRR